MATTTNYGWDTPDDTDLVKDGAAAIRTLGSSIDTTTKNLNPETTLGDLAYRSATANVKTRLALGSAGQVLRVNSGGTAPEWATTADQTPLTTKGDLFGFDTADARIPIGTNGHILTADSTQSLGLKWAAPAGGGKVLQVVSTHWTGSFSTASASYVDVTNGELSITPSSASSKVLFIGSWYARGQGANDQNGGDLRILRGATEIDEPGFVYALLGSNSQSFGIQAAVGAHYLDSPATTSSTTYKIQIKQYNGTAYLERGGVITLMEIGA